MNNLSKEEMYNFIEKLYKLGANRIKVDSVEVSFVVPYSDGVSLDELNSNKEKDQEKYNELLFWSSTPPNS